MRKGTFSVQTANANSSAHNSRINPPKYLIGLQDGTQNYYELLKKDDDFILEAKAIYKEKIKQTMQKKQVENLIQETVLTLQPHQNENDVKELFKKLNKKYGGHELLEVSIHRDEGYFEKNGIAYYPTKNILNKNGDWYICSDVDIQKPKKDDFDTKVDISTFKKVYNIHAHAKFSMFDKVLGKSARMQKKDMSSRIKFVSDELGLLYAPDKETSRIKKSVNLIKDEHLARSRTAELIVKEAKTKINALKNENKSLSDKVVEFEKKSVSREDMSFYERILELMKVSKRKKEDIEELILEEIGKLQMQLQNLISMNSELNQRNEALELENLELKTNIEKAANDSVIQKELERLEKEEKTFNQKTLEN